MKLRISLLFSSLALCTSVFASQPNFTKADLSSFHWQPLALEQKAENSLSAQIPNAVGKVIGYKIPANQGTLKIKIASSVEDNKSVFVPNVLVLDSQFNPSVTYAASQFKFVEERGLTGSQYETELSLTPTANQDFIYLLVYTTAEDLSKQTTLTHPAKLLAKAKGNQPPAIADIQLTHSESGKISVEVDGVQSAQFIGLNSGGALFEAKQPTPQAVGKQQAVKNPKTLQKPAKAVVNKVENSTENYFNQAVKTALKAGDVNRAMNLVNEAEQLGLTTPRQIFLKSVSSK